MKSDTLRMSFLLVPQKGKSWTSEALLKAIRDGMKDDLLSVTARIGENISAELAESAKRLNATPDITAVEFTASGEGAIPALMKLAQKAGPVFARIADLQLSNIVVGHLHVVDERKGDMMAMIFDRRRPELPADTFFDWWLNHHVPLGQQLCGGTLPFSAEMIHVDRDLSREACALASIHWKPVDGYESLVSDQAALDAFFADQKIQQGLADDEAGGSIEPGSITTAILRILEV